MDIISASSSSSHSPINSQLNSEDEQIESQDNSKVLSCNNKKAQAADLSSHTETEKSAQHTSN